ncbi:glutamine--tRNA ligase/YqeY domain fusion protein [Porphyromonas gingivalis]|uniref:Glutamine--tRNA ligase n=1 Tax=Porphyromonas gingivalis TaxID=837 RepID=A0AAF0BAJ4_PORGN|nr:glutamine--tRNA ligase/YqeY domain fusion protein [Porphyromonas gingivalis]ATS06676.1 glutamine--tRNA ligase/YqeY domain fusion protein [Porphyromonas gingivalis]PDP59799.1 glutamine--tRNA ligase/YqeY domain fusion protein [Porphyromonas gingivalis]RZQ69542.1 glutamine--tRNA ligase/YqeY domain fusion protein [Porphyromonas gingivalis]WCG03334.1 glutamine--tRNA ligase/YqeY domain fusion protein [Porphyromonas gingivalis]SJL29553.1 glutamine--tRNA ligase [Porphyromonas gingivalis]
MNENKNSGIEEKKSLNFIEQIVESDLSEGKNDGRIQTRFPPEPNGYLHIGHAKAICIDFGIAQRYGGVCNLRFDDTNPVKEDVEYVDAIREDIEWLGFHWGNIYYASDYFQELYDFAERLIREGHAYVDEQTAEQIAAQKGSPTVPGTASPFRDRPAEESLDLFRRMNAGEFEEGAMTLRAKIDMASSNMHFRDPIIYRIIKHPHHRTGNEWNVYPMYDFAHGQSDYFEGVTHSICTLEFEVHRPLYNYFIELLRKDSYAPRQIEFNRLNLTYTMMSKRKLLQLVKDGLVSGWDDPRMPTLCGYRRRGYTPESIRNFIDKIGYTKYDGIIDVALLEHAVREDLNKRATRVSGVIDPIKLVITNYPEDKTEEMAAMNNPEDESAGVHTITFARELYIEKEDFMEDAPKKYFRMTPGQEVRLKSSYIVRCTGCKKDEDGSVVEVYAEYDPLTLSGMPESNRKVKGTIHWVSARHSLPAEVRLYDRLFTDENPSDIKDKTLAEMLNPDSLKVLKSCRVEPFLADAAPGSHFQFQRIGYFTVDPDSRPGALVFNRTVSLKDSWQKAQKNA